MVSPGAESGAGRRLSGRVAALLRGSLGKAMLTIADQGLVSAANFLSGIIVGRACLKEEFGLYVLGFTIVLFAMNTQNSLVSSAYVVFSPRMDAQERARYTGSTLAHQLVLSGLLVLGLFAAGLALSFGIGPAGLGRVLMALSAVLAFILLKEYGRQVSFAGLRAEMALALDGVLFVFQVGGLGLLAWRGWLSADRAYLVMGAGAGVAALGWFVARRGQFANPAGQVVSDFRRNWAYCKWIFAMNLAYVACNQVYPWFLLTFHGSEANGEFGACSQTVFFANPFVLGLSNFLAPKTVHAYAEGGVAGMRRVVWKATVFFAVSMCLFALFMVFFGEWLLVLLYTDKYAGEGLTVAILAVGQLAWALTIPVNFGLNAMERPDAAFKSLLLALVFTMTAGVWMVKAFGPPGVAGGLLAGNIIAFLYNRWVYTHEINTRVRGRIEAPDAPAR